MLFTIVALYSTRVWTTDGRTVVIVCVHVCVSVERVEKVLYIHVKPTKNMWNYGGISTIFIFARMFFQKKRKPPKIQKHLHIARLSQPFRWMLQLLRNATLFELKGNAIMWKICVRCWKWEVRFKDFCAFIYLQRTLARTYKTVYTQIYVCEWVCAACFKSSVIIWNFETHKCAWGYRC